VSKKGVVDAQDTYTTKELGPGFIADKIGEKGERTYTKEKAEQIDKAMKLKGYLLDVKPPHSFGNPHDGVKYTYYKPGLWGNYGNVELIYEYGKIYASYNYGNHWWTHLMIDWMGSKWRKW